MRPVASISSEAARPLVDATLDFEVKPKTWKSARSQLKDGPELHAAGWAVASRSFERLSANMAW